MLATLPTSISSYQDRPTGSADQIRRRALERLYERRATVDELIDVLERYQEERRQSLAPCIDITAGRKWS